jgi:hypothetical protein
MRPYPRRLRGLSMVVGLLTLSACSLAPRVETDALAYHETADVTANRIILLNILRAKDSAPLHFAELSLIHGSLSEAGTLLLVEPIGPNPHSSSLPRASIAPSATVGDQVTFDLGTLDTQTFTQGVTSPISPKMLKYFLDSGVDHRLVLMLLLSSVRLPGSNEAIANYPRSERVVCYPDHGFKAGAPPPPYEVHGLNTTVAECRGRDREFVAFLRILNELPRVYAVSVRPFVPVGPAFRPDAAHLLHDLLAMDHTKQALRPVPGGLLQFGVLSTEDKVVLCEDEPRMSDGSATPAKTERTGLKALADKPCNPDTASDPEAATGRGPGATALPDFTLRSTLGIFSFLGQVLGSQADRSTPEKDVCITLDDQGREPDCSKGQVLFRLTHIRAQARFGVEYGGEFWGVPRATPCVQMTNHCDHTLETLSMVSLLLNLNKLARDIPSTPAVQLVP